MDYITLYTDEQFSQSTNVEVSYMEGLNWTGGENSHQTIGTAPNAVTYDFKSSEPNLGPSAAFVQHATPIIEYRAAIPGEQPEFNPDVHERFYYIKPSMKIKVWMYAETTSGIRHVKMGWRFYVGSTEIPAAAGNYDSSGFADGTKFSMRFGLIRRLGVSSFCIYIMTTNTSARMTWMSENFWQGTLPKTTRSSTKNATPSGFSGGRNMTHDAHTPGTASKSLQVLSTSGNGIHVYELTPTQYESLYDELWSAAVEKKFKDKKYSPKSGILGCYRIPFSTTSTVSVSGVNVCGTKLLNGSTVKAHSDNIIYVPTTGTFDFDFSSGEDWSQSFLDCDPYVQAVLDLPFIGLIPVNVNYFVYGIVGVRYIFDLITGNCLCEVYSRDLDRHDLLIGRYPGSGVYNMPLFANDQGGFAALGAFMGAAQIAGSAIATVATGGMTAPMLASSVISGGAQIGQAITTPHNTTMIGSLPSNISALTGDLDIRVHFIFKNDLQFIDSEDNDKLQQLFGRSAGCYATVETFKGEYLQGHIKTVTEVSDAENEAIKAAFERGVYL